MRRLGAGADRQPGDGYVQVGIDPVGGYRLEQEEPEADSDDDTADTGDGPEEDRAIGPLRVGLGLGGRGVLCCRLNSSASLPGSAAID